MFRTLRRLHIQVLVPVVATAVLGVSAVAGAATLPRSHPHLDGRQAAGVVTTVNGTTAAGTCGTAGSKGDFVLTKLENPSYTATVDVTATTTFKDGAVKSPSFADVCVGDYVTADGTASGGILTATKVRTSPPPGSRVHGRVTAVNNVTTAGTCGTAGATGDFVLTKVDNPSYTATVDVTGTTTFKDWTVKSATFADVCVGDFVIAKGTLSSGAVDATTVRIYPPVSAHASGQVTSVNDVNTAGTCGTAGATGDFLLTNLTNSSYTTTVDVASVTTFKEAGVKSPSFADVCVGDVVSARGASSSGVLTATIVRITPPPVGHVKGDVTSVNGVKTAGTCGTAGAAGSFTLVKLSNESYAATVDVTATTTFKDPAVPSPSFADVCVGSQVSATGTSSSGGLTATKVSITPPPSTHVSGVVTAVDGVITSGTCGTAGAAGDFTLAATVDGTSTSVTVYVTTTTTFKDPAVTSPSFADVCVGATVKVAGALTAGTLTAKTVAVTPRAGSRAAGAVVAVNGVDTPGTCGTAGAAGKFTLANVKNPNYTARVEVTSATTFKDTAVTSPSFADVCVGLDVSAVGTSSSHLLLAGTVTITPPPMSETGGEVTAVDGVSKSGTCGTAGAAGRFAITSWLGANSFWGKTVHVAVTATTTFKDATVANPSFADVCIGRDATVVGTLSSGVLIATQVTIGPLVVIG